MRFSSVSSILTTAAALFASTALATSPSSSSSTTDQRYEKYHAISPKSSIDLDSAIFNDVISAPRDYYVAALLTARDHRYGCTICRDVQPEFDLLAGSWNKGVEKHGDETPKVIWGTLDFMKGRPIFQQMMLQSAPVLLVYAPTTGPNAKPDKAPFKYDFNSQMTAEQLYNLISRLIPDGYKPPIHRPTNWARIITLTTALLGTFTLFTVLLPYIRPLIQNRNLWAALSLIGVLLFTSGHMFNHIRKTPYISGDGHGGVQYLVPGFQVQLGMESQIIAAVYAALAFGTIVLAMKVPRIADTKKQQLSVAFWGILIFGMYSLLLSIFRFKNPGYPFYLPPF